MPALNPLIISKINEGNRLYAEGNKQEAIKYFIAILDELDDIYNDRYESAEARLIMMSIYSMYLSEKNYVEAKQWAEDIFNCDIPEGATSELINLGLVYFELNEKDKAYECFLKAYEKGKHRAFKEYDPKYWEFFKSRHK